MKVTGSAEVELLRLEAYSDADYANDQQDRRSIRGYVTMLNGRVVSYGSRKQGLNAQSTMEAEYVTMNEGARDVMCLRGLCDELMWKMQSKLANFQRNGTPAQVQRVKWLRVKHVVQQVVLVLPAPVRKRKKRKMVTVAGRLLTPHLLDEIASAQEATRANRPKRVQKQSPSTSRSDTSCTTCFDAHHTPSSDAV
ncbi:hypothetical protein PR003_g24743 [Phytophthora rubi]|uniref:Reverse transcriptase Ty1/copia-type domain-containing protein n=1 Tax=Phytophthora rubi TaxID=129364 RepID=A0A6A4CUB4_9STRA|nr:hypothetical protein PR003_g24743 [Phytophthora rubi]